MTFVLKKHIPNLLTCLNLITGSVGIYYTLAEQVPQAFYFVLVAGMFDFLDGFAARLLNVRSEIGKQLDSLADLISFGLLPSFFMLKQLEQATPYHWMAISIAVFSAIRLAKFNLDDSQSDHFKGLPTPANALMLTSLGFLPIQLYSYTLMSICVLSSILLISPIRLLALKFSSASWNGNEDRWILIGGVTLLLVVFNWSFIPLLIPFYLLVSIVSFAIKEKK